LYNCNFYNIEDEQLDIITSLIMLMLTMHASVWTFASHWHFSLF